LRSWNVTFGKDLAILGASPVQFLETRPLYVPTGKILKWSWFKRVVRLTCLHAQYAARYGIEEVLSPDQKRFDRFSFFAILAQRAFPSNEIPEQFAFLCGVSTDDEIGIFGLWPVSFWFLVREKPSILPTVEKFLVNAPSFWKRVEVIATASDALMKELLAAKLRKIS
jgi:hypothetical protein